MKKIAEAYKQNDQCFLSLTLNHDIISKNSEVLVYGENTYGYQREINNLHLKRMINSLENMDEGSAFSPTSILLGVSPEDIHKCLDKVEFDYNGEYYIFDTKKIKNFKFRIIDGQHRIKAFTEVIERNNIDTSKIEKLRNYQFNVIIALIPENLRFNEVEMFRTINSKAKPLKTDLAMLAKYKYEVMFKKEDIKIQDHIQARIIFQLNENNKVLDYKDNYWQNGIKIDVNNSESLGTVGFKSFNDSISKIVSHYIKSDNEPLGNLDSSEKDFEMIEEYLEKHSKILLNELFLPAWDVIFKKWSNSFRKERRLLNDEIYTTFYNKDYYIQQTMGIKSLHRLLAEIYLKESDLKNTIKNYKDIIKKSPLTDEDWKKGGEMKGLSSEAGFKIISDKIKGKRD